MTGPLLRLRADAYYVPVDGGVWIRTTNGSFTLRGANAATWVQHLAPLLDSGVVPEELYASLRPEQTDYARRLIQALEQHGVVRWEAADDDPILSGVFAQQTEFLRHVTPDAATAMRAVRACRVAVSGPSGRAAVVAAALAEAGFADIALLDAEPAEELRAVAADYADRGAPVRFTRTGPDLDGRHVLGVFSAQETDRAWTVADRATAAGVGAWIGLVRGQSMLLKGQLPGSATACVRCAWRRLVHSSVGLAPADGLGHTQVSLAAAVLGQEMFQVMSMSDDTRLTEGVVVDMPRLSIWRTAVDADPACPDVDVHRDSPRAPDRPGTYPEAVFAARCFGPLVGCSPERYLQVPLAAVRLRINPPGRAEPAADVDGPIVVAESMAIARAEAALLAVRGASTGDAVADVGRNRTEAMSRALLRYADTGRVAGWRPGRAGSPDGARRRLAGLAGALPDVGFESHPSGLWRARVAGGAAFTGLDRNHAEERALLHALGEQQLPRADARVVPAADRPDVDDVALSAMCGALGLTPHPVPVPPLVAAHLEGVAL